MKKLSLSLALLSLTIFVGCSTSKPPNIVVQEKHILLRPPASMLADPADPVVVEVKETRHILDNSDAFEAWGKRAVAQIRALRDWYAKQPDPPKGK